jgi:hypothetical protein
MDFSCGLGFVPYFMFQAVRRRDDRAAGEGFAAYND